MIQYFIDLPIEKQTWSVLALSWLLVTVSAAIRERVKATECRNWARAMGVVGVGLVSLQAIHATMLVEELNTELMVRRGTHDVQQTEAVATQIADPVRVVAVASEYSTTIGDRTVSITRYSDGRTGPVSVGSRRGNSIWNRIGSGPDEFATEGRAGHGTERPIDDVQNDAHVGSF